MYSIPREPDRDAERQRGAAATTCRVAAPSRGPQGCVFSLMIQRPTCGIGVARDNDGTVMVIEDDGAMRALLQDVLERAGYRVIALPDGRTLETLIDREFEAVILDRELPGPGGEELLSLLRRRRPDAPVIF